MFSKIIGKKIEEKKWFKIKSWKCYNIGWPTPSFVPRTECDNSKTEHLLTRKWRGRRSESMIPQGAPQMSRLYRPQVSIHHLWSWIFGRLRNQRTKHASALRCYRRKLWFWFPYFICFNCVLVGWDGRLQGPYN